MGLGPNEPTVKIQVRLPKRLLNEVEQRTQNRAAWIREAIIEKLERDTIDSVSKRWKTRFELLSHEHRALATDAETILELAARIREQLQRAR